MGLEELLMMPEFGAQMTGIGMAQMAGDGGSQGPSIGEQITKMVNSQNDILNAYMQKAIDSSTEYSGHAINEQRSGLNTANNYLMDYLNKASTQAQNQSLLGNIQSMGLAQAYLNTGGKATDSMMSSLGLATPIVGTAAIQSAINNQNTAKQKIDLGMQQLLTKYGIKSPLEQPQTQAKPSQNPADYYQGLTGNQVYGYIAANSQPVPGQSNNRFIDPYTGARVDYFAGGGLGADLVNQALTDPNFVNSPSPYNVNGLYNTYASLVNIARNDLGTARMGQANTAYNSYLADVDKYNKYTADVGALQSSNQLSPMDQSILDAYNKGFFGSPNI